MGVFWLPEVKKMAEKVLRLAAVSFFLVSAFAAAGFSQTSPSKNFPNIKISNFGRMDERFYRGAQPKKGSYEALKALGIHTNRPSGGAERLRKGRGGSSRNEIREHPNAG